jgi:hypothetical protein
MSLTGCFTRTELVAIKDAPRLARRIRVLQCIMAGILSRPFAFRHPKRPSPQKPAQPLSHFARFCFIESSDAAVDMARLDAGDLGWPHHRWRW